VYSNPTQGMHVCLHVSMFVQALQWADPPSKLKWNAMEQTEKELIIYSHVFSCPLLSRKILNVNPRVNKRSLYLNICETD
jgi:hypothetical protein